MIIGGVPYYWTLFDARKSMAANIDSLFFRDEGELHNEFRYIYSSMFRSPEKYIKVVEALSGKKAGLTRDEIIAKTGMSSNGQLSEILEDLSECGFIRKYCNLNKNVKDALYQLIDFYTLFYYRFLKNASNVDENYWLRLQKAPAYSVWCGLAFEKVCLMHSRQIKKALGIEGVMTNIFSWNVKANQYHPGTQIDLLFDRADNIIDVCEIKYAPQGYNMTAASLRNIRDKISVLSQYISSQKFVEPVMITSNGMNRNKYSEEVTHQITGASLFED